MFRNVTEGSPPDQLDAAIPIESSYPFRGGLNRFRDAYNGEETKSDATCNYQCAVLHWAAKAQIDEEDSEAC